MKAKWNNQVIAESNETMVVEGNHYFPSGSVIKDYLRPSDTHTNCHWKGKASYYSIEVYGKTAKDAAWYYTEPKEAAKEIKGCIAFWRGVVVEN